VERATPESLGIPSGAILEWVDELERIAPDFHSLMIVRHGRVAAEGWWAPNAPELSHALFSVSKSFTSTAVGMAIAEGRFGLDDPVVSFFPDEAPASVSPNLAAMKVRHLLAMCTGHTSVCDSVFETEGNWSRAFLALPVEYEPGTHFTYNTPATYMLSAIIQKKTGLRLLDYLGPRLFEPLGIDNPTWEQNQQGINVGGFGLRIRTEDIARFGQLYLQKGVWGGKRLISAEWVDAATSKKVEARADFNPHADWLQGYGYQFWRGCHDSFRGDGAFGQFCLVVPDKDLVIAMTAGIGPMHEVLESLWRVVLPGLQATALPEDPAAQQALRDRLAGLRLTPRPGASESTLEQNLAGAVYSFEPNPLSLKSFRFEFSAGGGAMLVFGEGADGPRRLEFGRGKWLTGQSDVMPDWQGRPIAASAAWPRPDCLELDASLYTDAFRYTLRFEFSGPEARVSVSANVAFGPTDLGEFKARRTTASIPAS
jgi:CubicO group peptidase (beta-lactamase class C family)